MLLPSRPTGGPLNIQYDVFEILPDGSAILRAFVKRTKHVLEMLKAVGMQTNNECFATNLNRRKIIGSVNEGRSRSQVNVHEH